jgi:hypothetical protein
MGAPGLDSGAPGDRSSSLGRFQTWEITELSRLREASIPANLGAPGLDFQTWESTELSHLCEASIPAKMDPHPNRSFIAVREGNHEPAYSASRRDARKVAQGERSETLGKRTQKSPPPRRVRHEELSS